jgi:adenosylcobinamide-phosphate synthase
MERAVLLISALVLNAVIAGPRRWYAPLHASRLTAYPARLIRSAERKLNREHRSEGERETRGLVLVITVVTASALLGLVLGWLFQSHFGFAELLLLIFFLPVRPTWDCVAQIRRSLAAGNLPGARDALADSVWRHHALMDEYGVARAGIEMLAVHFSEKIVAPALWYLLLGLPGLLISKAIYMMQEALALPVGGHGFGGPARKAHALLHYIPARIASILWLFAGLFLPGANPSRAAKQIGAGLITDAPQALSVRSAAAVLDVSLGGAVSVYAGQEWYGGGTARPLHTDVKRGLYAFVLLNLFAFILAGFFL